ncbi:MAG: hypothetical protein WC830_15055 [Burkholderiales bacterium]|jgi:hypothetical protein
MTVPKQISPIRLFATLLLLIFSIEGATMFALDSLSPRETPSWVSACIDAGLLAVVTSLVVWRLFIQPLKFALLGETAQNGSHFHAE